MDQTIVKLVEMRKKYMTVLCRLFQKNHITIIEEVLRTKYIVRKYFNLSLKNFEESA